MITETNLATSTQAFRAAIDTFSKNSSNGVTVGQVENVDIVSAADGMQALEKGLISIDLCCAPE